MTQTTAGGKLNGFDMSIYAGIPDWGALAGFAQVQFAFVEAARGLEQSKPFAEAWRARPASIKCGPYQRFFSTATGTEQAKAFVAAFQGLTLAPGDLPPVLDVEYDVDSRQSTGMSAAGYMKEMTDWISAVETHFNRRPIIYTNPSFWREYLHSPAEYGRFPLWIADYSAQTPDVPAPWGAYTFWQYAKEQVLAGCPKDVDLDYFIGDTTMLEQLVADSILK